MKTQPHFYLATNLLAGHSYKFMLIQSILSIVLGIFFMVHYASALFAFALFLGIMLLGCGIQGFATMLLNRHFKWGFALYSLFWFLAGLVMIAEPFASGVWMMLVLGIWFIIHAIELFIGAAADKLHTPGFRWLVVLNGVVTLLFGLLIVTTPIAAAEFFNLMFAFFLIFYGAVTLGVALRFRKINQRLAKESDPASELGAE
ncbi:MAG: DUF308 domain-containing protein [Victivallales bacterium]|jgi:uncharacterized membrane protein HdeD (DUF308 family)|nr:DUF308 domain-containing protein [Victivallales bacterium]